MWQALKFPVHVSFCGWYVVRTSQWLSPSVYLEAAHFAFMLQLKAVPIYGKMAGAVGNYNAHITAYPDVHWDAVAEQFVSGLGLQLNPYVTQVRLKSVYSLLRLKRL